MNEHDDLASAFASYRVQANRGFTAAQVESIFDSARRRKTRRMMVSGTAALLAVSGLLTAGVLMRPSAAPEVHPPAVSGSVDTPFATPPTPAAGPPSASAESSGQAARRTDPGNTDPGNQVRFLGEATVQRIRNSTIVLPPWPAGSGACPAGRFTFVDGEVPTGQTDTIGRPYSYFILHRIPGVYASLDNVPGDEMVIPVACGFTEVVQQLLVVKESAGKLNPLGYLPRLEGFDRFYPQSGRLVVEVIDEPMSPSAEQRRWYSWTGSQFIQTGGPASFPANGRGDIRDVDLRNSYMHLTSGSAAEPPCGGGMLTFVDGLSGAWPSTTFELGEISTGLLNEPGEFAGKGDALVTVTCRRNSASIWVLWLSTSASGVLRVGDNGVTGVVSHRIVDGLAEIVVQTQTGRKIFRYASDGYTLTRQ